MIIIKIFLSALIVGLFLYSKLLPYKDNLNEKYKGLFSFINSIFSPLLKGLKTLIKPFQVGQGLSVDMSQIVLLVLLLLINNLLR